MTNTPMTSREAFEAHQVDRGFLHEEMLRADTQGNYYNHQMRNDWLLWQASQAQQASVIAELQTDLSQAKETIETLNAGKPIGDIVGLHIAQNAVTKALGYKQTIAELVEALEEAMYSNSTETAKQKYQAIIAKVKDK